MMCPIRMMLIAPALGLFIAQAFVGRMLQPRDDLGVSK
jgi:hypothetical protein